MSKKKRYRPNVAAIVLSSDYPEKIEFFIAERSDLEGVWQFPQGGIDKNEKPKKALFRELLEEIGTDRVEIIAKLPGWIRYDFPEAVRAKMAPYAGQKQRYYLVRLKKKALINLQTEHPEFCSYRFVGAEELFGYISHFKKPVYEEAIAYFKEKGYL